MFPRLPLGFDGWDHEENLTLVSFRPSICDQHALPYGVPVQLVDADTDLGHDAKDGDPTLTLLFLLIHEERESEGRLAQGRSR